MTIWIYDMNIPDDTPDDELEGYRNIAVNLWETSAETVGGYGVKPTATLIDVENPGMASDPITGEPVSLPHRRWHVEGTIN